MKPPFAIFIAIALVVAPVFAATKEAPSRPAGKQCQWERVADATLGLEASVQRCDFGSRKIHLYAKGNALLMHYSDGGEDEKILALPVHKLTAMYDNVHDIGDMQAIQVERVKHFFSHYKDLEPGKWAKIDSVGDLAAARKVIADAIERAKAGKD